MSIFNSNGKKNNNDGKNNGVNTPASESTYLEFSVVNDNHSRYSAAPNITNIDDDDSDVTIQNLNTNNSKGGNDGKNN